MPGNPSVPLVDALNPSNIYQLGQVSTGYSTNGTPVGSYNATAAIPIPGSYQSPDFPPPLTPATINVDEEFFGSSSLTGQIGTYGWGFTNINATGGTVALAGGSIPNIGLLDITTSTALGQGEQVALGHAAPMTGSGAFGALGATSNYWDSTWIFQMGSTSNIAVRIGFQQVATTGAEIPANGIYLRYDTGASPPDTSFAFCVDVGSAAPGTETCTPSGTLGTSFFRLRINNFNSAGVPTSGLVSFSLYSSTGALVAGPVPIATPPGVSLSPAAEVYTNSSTAQMLQLDAFEFQMRGLIR